MDETTIMDKLGKIEREIAEIKAFLTSKSGKAAVIKLGGVLEGVEINEEDFDQAKKSLFKVPDN